MPNSSNKSQQQKTEIPVLDYANSYLMVLKTASKDVLAKFLQEVQDNELFKKTIIDFNRPLALKLIEQGVDIDLNDSHILFTLTLNYPETANDILQVLQPSIGHTPK